MVAHTNRISIPPASTTPSHEVFREVFDEPSVKAMARALKVSSALLYKWQEPTGINYSGALNPLDRIAEITRLTGDTRLVEWLCHQAGGYFVPAPAPVVDVSRCINTVTRNVAGKLVGTLEAITDASSDGVICQRETAIIRETWNTTVGVVESVVVATERGMFAASPLLSGTGGGR
jgi:hypothetical protein